MIVRHVAWKHKMLDDVRADTKRYTEIHGKMGRSSLQLAKTKDHARHTRFARDEIRNSPRLYVVKKCYVIS